MSIQPDNNLPGGLPNPDVERILNRFVGVAVQVNEGISIQIRLD